MKKIISFVASWGILASMSAVPLPEYTAHAAAKDAVCMSSMAKGARAGQELTILVARDRVEEFIGRGFSTVPCQGKQNSLPMFERNICKLAEKAPASVIEELVNAYSVSPVELCQMARQLRKN